ncbi:MAG TPA: ComF family protein [Pyrinomonadaceae bacterium]|nr:ComF family protein [Pyrinomonadaceae bacterium]
MFLTSTFSQLYDAAFAILYPQACAICGQSVESRADGIACTNCWRETRLFHDDETFCWKCGELSRQGLTEVKPEEVSCRRCDLHAFSAARACGAYAGALRASVLSLKHRPYISARLTGLLLTTQKRVPLTRATRIIPVPLHPRREKSRGFNQAAVMARELSRVTGLPLDETTLIRVAHSERYRAGMSAHARRASVEKAFAVIYPRLISDERILLVDDVYTTGATVSSCADTLLSAGAKEVFVLTIARASFS